MVKKIFYTSFAILSSFLLFGNIVNAEETVIEESQETIEEETKETIEEEEEEEEEEEKDLFINELYGNNIPGAYINWSLQEVTPLGYVGGDGHTSSTTAWLLSPDRDVIYIYLGNVVPWIGERSTGNFTITTDIGNQYLININDAIDGQVIKGDNNEVLHHYIISTYIREDGAPDCDIELAVPIADLPNYRDVVSFGLYMENPVLTELQLPSRISPEEEEIVSTSSLFQIDGDYSEWQYINREQLDYSTNGGQDNKVDGYASIYSEEDYIYGYCLTEDAAHTQNAFDATYVTLYNRLPDYDRFPWNGGYEFSDEDLTFRYGIIDSEGNITSVDLNNITEGTHRYAIFAINGWGIDGQNINNLQGQDLYGYMCVTVEQGQKVEMEYEVNKELFAKRYKLSMEDIKNVSSYYVRIGGTVSAAGTPIGVHFSILAIVLLSISGFFIHFIQKKEAV